MAQINNKFKNTVIVSTLFLLAAIILPISAYVLFSTLGKVAVGPEEIVGTGMVGAWIVFFLISSIALTVSGISAVVATYFLIKIGGWKSSSSFIKIGYILSLLSLAIGILILSVSWFAI